MPRFSVWTSGRVCKRRGSAKMQPGDLVICIYDDWYPVITGVRYPVKGCVYTIADVEVGDSVYRKDKGTFAYLRFEELRGPSVIYNGHTGEPQWNADSFRPVRKPDISALKVQLACQHVQ